MLLLISVGVLLTRRQHPGFLAGWLWFLGTLVPVIGLVQAGDQSLADRYFYVPGIGLLIMLVWGAAALLQRWPRPAQAGAAICGVVAGLLFAVTHWQLGFWRDTETLFGRAIVVTKNNYLAHHILGVALEKRGLLDQAIAEFSKSLRERPNYAEAHNSLGLTLEKAGQPEQAISHYRQAIALRPEFTDPHFNLAVALGAAGRVEESAAEYEIVLKLDPSAADAHNNLGFLFDKRGALDQAILHYREAIRLKPNYARAHFNLGVALTRQASPTTPRLVSIWRLCERRGRNGLDPDRPAGVFPIALVELLAKVRACQKLWNL
jgi:tetratricopeptide (TPR) repeat protein